MQKKLTVLFAFAIFVLIVGLLIMPSIPKQECKVSIPQDMTRFGLNLNKGGQYGT